MFFHLHQLFSLLHYFNYITELSTRVQAIPTPPYELLIMPRQFTARFFTRCLLLAVRSDGRDDCLKLILYLDVRLIEFFFLFSHLQMRGKLPLVQTESVKDRGSSYCSCFIAVRHHLNTLKTMTPNRILLPQGNLTSIHKWALRYSGYQAYIVKTKSSHCSFRPWIST